jgi:enhancing lycopene biosynthesis protein 2
MIINIKGQNSKVKEEKIMKKKVGVLLSGCGVFDGSEIHEAVLSLLMLDRAGAESICIAPDMDQFNVINHMTQSLMDEKRNVLVESARIARGKITDLKDIHASDFDALIMPGGLGAANNLSDFAAKGSAASVHPEVARLLQEMVSAGKPVGAICISPVILAKALSDKKPEVTIGNNRDTASAIEAMGGKHTTCAGDGVCVDKKNRLVTTPAYMLGPGIKEVAAGIEKLVDQVLAMA